uniref:Uncharacterized protein n=1 Tax=Candidatus Kentrum sp. SD TaxID=2126332 RepID=A0A451BRM0_9GAMM|nr:MAG: hypothetical protein BECKSD772D_GA0070982_11771 [Candidatus Kentron sp. SD]
MTPAQKIKMGKAVADDLGKRYKFTQSGKPEATLSDILKQGKPIYPKGLDAFLDRSNPLYQKFERGDVLRLLVEKGAIEKFQIEEHMKQQSELFQSKEAFDNLANAEIQQTLTESMEKEVFNIYEKMVLRMERNRPMNFMSFLSFQKEEGIISPQQCKVLSELEKLEDKQVAIEERINELEERFLKGIEEKWRSGELKHALLNHTPKAKKRKTTLARSVPINQIYPEQRKQKLKEIKYEGKDIKGLETFTFKEFQALHFLAHKAQNQTEEEKEAVEIYKELGGFEDEKFRTISYKESEYITHAQGKDHSLVSTSGREACISAIQQLQDVEFSVLWENKEAQEKQDRYVVVPHAMMRKLTLKKPWSIIEKTEGGQKIKNFHFIAIPERVFKYQEIEKDGKYKGVKTLFDVINVDPDFFNTLKYSEPEIQHVSEALMRLSLLFIIEGSYRKEKKFVIDEEKLLKRIGLIGEKGKDKKRAIETLRKYTEKLINHKTLESIEKKDNQLVFKIAPKETESK